MNDVFLKVNKDFFKLGLNPTEILVLAQVMEFTNNTSDCFMSDKRFAEMFGVSDKTISRALKTLEDKKFIKRDTKNIKGGKERHISINISEIEKQLTKDKMSVVNEETKDLQGTKCLLSMDKLSVINGQNDLIKDNIKDNVKDNIADSFTNVQESDSGVPKVEEISREEFKRRFSADFAMVIPLKDNKYKIYDKFYQVV